MARKTATIAIALALGVADFAAGAKLSCDKAPSQLEKLQKEVDALTKLRQEMNDEFEGVLQKDMRSAAEGEKDTVHRSTAVKLAFARNRLNKKIEAKEKEHSDLAKEYCKGCAPDRKTKDRLAQFCELCEDASRCPEDQEG
jgi:hypothetical protein